MENFRKMTIKELRQKCQSTAPEVGRDPLVGITVRFLSIYITKFLISTAITPFWVTALSVILFLAGVGVFALNSFVWNLIGIAIIYVSVLLDGCNGELARLQKYRPDIGAIYIEPVSHDIQYGLMFLPLSYGAYLATGSVGVIFAGFIATASKLINRFLLIRYLQIIQLQKKETDADKKSIDTEGEAFIPFNPNVSFPHKVYRFVNRNFFSSVGLIVPLLICTLYKRVDIFVYLFAAVYTAFALLHFFREIRHIIKIDKPMV